VIGIRPFSLNDIPQVAALHREAMATSPSMTTALMETYSEWLTATFLESPMRLDGLESIVYEEDGEVVAFLGVLARQVSIGGKIYRASATSNFCALPARRGRLGLQIAKEHVARSSDLTFIDELQDRPRRVFEFAGMLPMPQSVRWTLPLQPGQHVLSLVEHRVPKLLTAAVRPATHMLDRLAARVSRSPFHYKASELTSEQLTPADLSRLLMEFGTPEDLRPVTTDGSTAWLVERARRMTQHGELHMIALRDSDGDVVGWYVYYANRGRPSDVLQLVATRAAAPQVLDHLARHAGARGVVSLTGTLDPVFLSALSQHWAVISPRETRWMMVYSARSEILEAFWRCRLLLSRLDGEWCQHLF